MKISAITSGHPWGVNFVDRGGISKQEPVLAFGLIETDNGKTEIWPFVQDPDQAGQVMLLSAADGKVRSYFRAG